MTSFEYNGDLGHPPLRSTAAATRLAAVERIFASGLAPLSILSCAGRSDYAIGDFLAGQPLPIASRGAGSGERVASARAHVRMQFARLAVRVPRPWCAVLGDPAGAVCARVPRRRSRAGASRRVADVGRSLAARWSVNGGAFGEGFGTLRGLFAKNRACGAAPKW